MAIQIGAKPDSGFDDPLGMLKDCHRRIERFLHILCWVAEKAEGREMTEEEREAIEAALQYFSRSGPLHNLDEEESLFPRLRNAGGAQVLDEMSRLESDHQKAARLHEEAAVLYTRWMQGKLSGEDTARLREVTKGLQGIYGDHIKLEEQVVFPAAAKLFDRSTLLPMGEEFKARRERI